MFRQALAKHTAKLNTRAFTHVPRIASTGRVTSVHEHQPVEMYSGNVVFNEDLAIEHLHEKAIASDSVRAASNFDEVRVLSSHANVLVYGEQ